MVISRIEISYKLSFFLMSPWTIRNKPIKPKERLKILLMIIFWSDPSKYPSTMVRSISKAAPGPICPSIHELNFRPRFSREPCLQWPEFQKMNSIQAKVNYARTHQVDMNKLSALKNHDFRNHLSPESLEDEDRRPASFPVLDQCLPFLFISFTFKVINFDRLQFWSFW